MASKGTKYILHYWPGIPGRGEFIRLAFESTSHPYKEKHDPLNVCMKANKPLGHPPHFAPPVLEVVNDDSKSSSSSAFISQTPAILAYLAPILGLDGVASTLNEHATLIQRAQVNQLTLTILDLNNETHDVHHPVASGAYYEEQREEAMRRAKDFRATRIPKFFQLYQLALESNPNSKEWLISSNFTTADLALFQVCLLHYSTIFFFFLTTSPYCSHLRSLMVFTLPFLALWAHSKQVGSTILSLPCAIGLQTLTQCKSISEVAADRNTGEQC